EAQLAEGAKQPGFLIQLLQLIDNANGPDHFRQAASVYFKNVVKVAWDASKDDGERKGIVISDSDRNTIKQHLVELMCTVPPKVQKQISAAISIIAKLDFPENWDSLLPSLTQKFGSDNATVVNGVLTTADSIFMSFRHVERSDELYKKIIYTLNKIQEPLLVLFIKASKEADALANNAAPLADKMETLRLIVSIYHSLTYQDLPAYFEDNNAAWMEGFSKYLQYQNPILVDDDEEETPEPIAKLQKTIVDVLKLYAERDEEVFALTDDVSTFTGLVWKLLLGTSKAEKYDQLVVVSMKYLSILLSRQNYSKLFNKEDTLQQIVSNIVIPNMMLRESDVHNFDDNPQEFIMIELEGADNESRRRCGRDLLKAMCRQFEAQTTGICSQHLTRMVAEFEADPANKWISKDTAISLMIGITVRKESSHGVSEINGNVDLMGFFERQIYPELQDKDHSRRPFVKATSLNFVGTFRNQFTKEQLVQLLPVLISNLASPTVVVKSLAANTIEQIERSKDASGALKLSRADLEPHLESLFGALFAIIGDVNLNENQYAMKCIMRSLDRVGDGVIAVTGMVFQHLSAALDRVCKNPRVPEYNHSLFESLAILVKGVCSKDPARVSDMEALLFPPFQIILQMDILEFTPYVFQILAQMLEYRPAEQGLGEAYTSLFEPCIAASTWEATGNVPGLTRLMQAYVKKAAPEIVSMGKLTPLLGIFQKLNASGKHEASAFDLLNTLIQYVPQNAMGPALGTIFQLVCTRLQSTKSNLYPIRAAQFFALFCGLYGGQAYVDVTNGIQQDLGMMLAGNIWLSKSSGAASSKILAKAQVVGFTRYACETSLVTSDNGRPLLAQVLFAVLSILSSESFSRAEKDILEEVPMSYDATFSSLKYATKIPDDPFLSIADPVEYFLVALKALSESHPGVIAPLLSPILGSDPKLATGFENMLKSKGISLV
ncbi:MAG: hypothetical protein SGILL_007850, partial [Bacillariaceae sp.]